MKDCRSEQIWLDFFRRMSEFRERFFQMILATASGKKTKSEEFGYGEDEFAPWTLGATM